MPYEAKLYIDKFAEIIKDRVNELCETRNYYLIEEFLE